MANRPNKKTTTTQSTWIRFKSVEWIFMNLPFVCFLVFLGIFYIFNAHSVERKMRKIDDLKTEVSEVKSRYMDIKTEINYGSTQSQIQKRVADLQLKPVEKAPIKIKTQSH